MPTPMVHAHTQSVNAQYKTNRWHNERARQLCHLRAGEDLVNTAPPCPNITPHRGQRRQL